MGEFLAEKVRRPVRSKKDIILLLLETMKLFDRPEEEGGKSGRIILCIDKMSRIFFQTEDKYFSFLFPFSLEKQECHYRIYDKITDYELSEKIISMLIRIFSQSDAFEQSFERAIDYIIESMEEYEFENIDDIWRLVIRLWYMEDGYVRYDHDPQRQRADIHPLYHLDINYSPGAAYKLGLRKPLLIGEFKDILDLKTDCAYLTLNA